MTELYNTKKKKRSRALFLLFWSGVDLGMYCVLAASSSSFFASFNFGIRIIGQQSVCLQVDDD